MAAGPCIALAASLDVLGLLLILHAGIGQRKGCRRWRAKRPRPTSRSHPLRCPWSALRDRPALNPLATVVQTFRSAVPCHCTHASTRTGTATSARASGSRPCRRRQRRSDGDIGRSDTSLPNTTWANPHGAYLPDLQFGPAHTGTDLRPAGLVAHGQHYCGAAGHRLGHTPARLTPAGRSYSSCLAAALGCRLTCRMGETVEIACLKMACTA